VKITKKILKRVISEELKTMLHETAPTGWEGNLGPVSAKYEKEWSADGGSSPTDYVPFDGNPRPSPADIEAETEKLADWLGISFEEADAMVKEKTAEMEAKMEKAQPLGEQSTLLNEDFGEIIGAVFANLFAEAGFHLTTGIVKSAGSPHSGGSGGSGGSSDPDIDPTGDKVLDSNYAWQWSDDFLRALKLGKLSPEQLEKLKYGAEMNWRDDGDMLANYERSKNRAAMQSSMAIPEGIRERKITKKQLKRIIQEETQTMLEEGAQNQS